MPKVYIVLAEERDMPARMHRFDRPSNTWSRIEWSGIKKDDAIWIESEYGSQTILAASDHDPITDWVEVFYIIDPATNEWVQHPYVTDVPLI